jgi:heme exporter protein D
VTPALWIIPAAIVVTCLLVIFLGVVIAVSNQRRAVRFHEERNRRQAELEQDKASREATIRVIGDHRSPSQRGRAA